MELGQTSKESIKFAIVGASGVLVNFIALSVAQFIFGASDEVAFAVGILTSVTTNYGLNRIWTFSSTQSILGEYLKYLLSNGVGMVLQFAISVILENYFESVGLYHLELIVIDLPSLYLASLAGILVGFVANFIFSKYFVFNDLTEE